MSRKENYNKEYYEKNKERIKEYQKNWRNLHREELNKYHREWKKNHPEEARKSRIDWAKKNKRKRPIAKCSLCNETSKLVYDHNHKTGNFRGWICMKCNVLLGMANDSIDTLERCIEYLRKDTED